MNEQKIMELIIKGSDWEEVLETIVAEEQMDPRDIDIVKLTDVFLDYLRHLRMFDFRIPARFILIAAILLRLKCERIFAEEMEKEERASENVKIELEKIEALPAPFVRKPVKKVALTELIEALHKALEMKKVKEERRVRLREKVEQLIGEEDIEKRIMDILERIKQTAKNNVARFSELLSKWERKEIVEVFLPLLHLDMEKKIKCKQEKFYDEIYIYLCDHV